MRALLLGLLALSTTACKVSHETGYDSPMDTVLTFQSAFADHNPDLEYLCLAASLKQSTSGREGYILMRDRFFEPLGSIGRWVLRRNSLEDNLVGARDEAGGVMLGFEIVDRGFGLSLTREDVLVIHLRDGGEPLTGVPSILARGDQWRVNTEVSSGGLARMKKTGIEFLTLRGRWKIDGLHQPAPSFTDEGDPEEIAHRGSECESRLEGGPLDWKSGEEDLGNTPIEFWLPRPESEDARPVVWSVAPES